MPRDRADRSVAASSRAARRGRRCASSALRPPRGHPRPRGPTRQGNPRTPPPATRPEPDSEQLAADPRTRTPLVRRIRTAIWAEARDTSPASQAASITARPAGARAARLSLPTACSQASWRMAIAPSIAPAGQQAAERGQGQSGQLVRLVDLLDQPLQPGLGVVPRSVPMSIRARWASRLRRWPGRSWSVANRAPASIQNRSSSKRRSW